MTRIFALSDPHLSLAANKPMDVFGEKWQGHTQKIADNWRTAVSPEDIVLVAGDISWGMKLPEAQPDLDWLAALPGKKVLIKGNHDYWWSSVNKARAAAPGLHLLQNDALALDGVAIGGSRLWDFPFVRWPGPVRENPATNGEKKAAREKEENVDPEKIRRNEINRLRLSLSALDPAAGLRICMTHFPPISRQPEENELTQIMREFRIDICVYGHLHAFDAEGEIPAADCVIDGTRYVLSSCDWLDFAPRLIATI